MLYTLLSATIGQSPHNTEPALTELWCSTNDNAVEAFKLVSNFLTYLEHSISLSIILTYIIYHSERDLSIKKRTINVLFSINFKFYLAAVAVAAWATFASFVRFVHG